MENLFFFFSDFAGRSNVLEISFFFLLVVIFFNVISIEFIVRCAWNTDTFVFEI